LGEVAFEIGVCPKENKGDAAAVEGASAAPPAARLIRNSAAEARDRVLRERPESGLVSALRRLLCGAAD
jgi:hypothetical protein